MSIPRRVLSLASLTLVASSLLITGPSSAAGPRRGLVAHYCFNTTTVSDCSDTGNEGTATGSVSLVPGVLGKAARFGGYQDLGYVRVPASASLAFGNDFTISYWVRFDSFAGENAYGQSVPYATQIAVAKSHDRTGLFSYISASGGASGPEAGSVGVIDYGAGANFNAPIKPQLGKWVHVTFSQRSAPERARLYVDGKLVQTIEDGHYDFSVASGQPLYLGAQAPLFGGRLYTYPLTGALDEVRIYNRELQPFEIYLTVISDRLGIRN